MPLPFRSSASQASSDPEAVHEILSATLLLSRSNSTPPAALVSVKPFPNTSSKIGVPPPEPPLPGSPHCPPLHKPLQQSECVRQVSPNPPQDTGVGVAADTGSSTSSEVLSWLSQVTRAAESIALRDWFTSVVVTVRPT